MGAGDPRQVEQVQSKVVKVAELQAVFTEKVGREGGRQRRDEKRE